MTHPKLTTKTFPVLFALFFSLLLVSPAPADEKSKTSEENLVTLKVLVGGESKKILIELHPKAAPLHVANFKKQVEDGYYDGHAFHRVIRGYLIQVGDPLSREPDEKENWGTGGPGHTIPAEIGLPHNRGAVAMARLHKNNPNKESSGSQFYFCLAPIPQLDKEYTVFGKVIEGMDVLDSMGDTLTDSNDTPVQRIELKTAALGDVGAIGSLAMPNPIAGTKKAIAAVPNPLHMFGGKKDDDLSNKPAAYGDPEVPEGELPDVEYASEMNDVPSGPVDAEEKEGFMKKLNPFNGKNDKDLAVSSDAAPVKTSPAPAPTASGDLPDVEYAADMTNLDREATTEKEGGFFGKLNPFGGKKNKEADAYGSAAYEDVNPSATASQSADRSIPAPPSLPAGVTAAVAVDSTTTTQDEGSSTIPAEPLSGLDKISKLNFGNDDGSAPSRKPKKTEAEKGRFTKFIERLW